MKIKRIAYESFMTGLAAVLIWVLFWGIAFPDVWIGHGDYVLWVFSLSSIAYFAHRVKPLLVRRR